MLWDSAETGQRPAAAAKAEDQSDALSIQPACDKGEGVKRLLVDPLHVIDHAQQWALLGCLLKQCHGCEPDEETVRRRPCGQAKRSGESVTLGLGQVAKNPEEG